jgi:FKBP12-rapamycin complex-associated protein
MSVVGYLIGLGDRHPFNIMIQRDTAKVVHIDFGDCFEVNKMRKVFPEKVPFRLTRMLVNAMDACRTDGIFKHTC